MVSAALLATIPWAPEGPLPRSTVPVHLSSARRPGPRLERIAETWTRTLPDGWDTLLSRELPGGDVAGYIDASFRGGEWPCRGEFVLHAPAAEIAAWVRRQAVVEELGPDRCRVLAGSWSWDRLAAWVGMFDVDIEVVGPVELKEAAARLSRRYSAAAGA